MYYTRMNNLRYLISQTMTVALAFSNMYLAKYYYYPLGSLKVSKQKKG
jgi:hypothetical protein